MLRTMGGDEPLKLANSVFNSCLSSLLCNLKTQHRSRCSQGSQAIINLRVLWIFHDSDSHFGVNDFIDFM